MRAVEVYLVGKLEFSVDDPPIKKSDLSENEKSISNIELAPKITVNLNDFPITSCSIEEVPGKISDLVRIKMKEKIKHEQIQASYGEKEHKLTKEKLDRALKNLD